MFENNETILPVGLVCTYIKQIFEAEEMLHEELSIVLNIPYEDIPGYIRRQVEVTA